VTSKAGFYNKNHTSNERTDPRETAAASPAAQPAEESTTNHAEASTADEIADDAAANPDALQWKGVYCSTAENSSEFFETEGIVSVTATSTNGNTSVAKDVAIDFNDDEVEQIEEYNPDHGQLYQNTMGMKCSLTAFCRHQQRS